MQLPFPERLQYVAEGKKTMRLLVGTFSMSAETQRTIFRGTARQRSFPEYQIHFRWYENGKEQGDFPVVTGTMDPRQMTQGNQIALLVVDVAQSQGLLEEYKNYAAKRADGETIPFAMWAPDGAEGRYLMERESFYLDPWAQNKASNKSFWLLIGGIALVTLFITFFIPCVVCVLPLLVVPIGFVMKKTGKSLKGDQLSYPEYFTLIQNWMNQMSSDGTLHRQFMSAFGISEDGGGSGRL